MLLLFYLIRDDVKQMSNIMRKPDFCISVRDQLCSKCPVDQRLCFRYPDSAIPLLLIAKISSLLPASVTVQVDSCWTCSETTLLVFSRNGFNALFVNYLTEIRIQFIFLSKKDAFSRVAAHMTSGKHVREINTPSYPTFIW